MNRPTEPDFDQRIADWLEDEPNLAPTPGDRDRPGCLPIDPTAAHVACSAEVPGP